MSKKRTTKDEKRTLLIELLHEKKEPLTKEEFENLGAKKGVVRQAVLDVVKELTDDGEIQTDKIGTAVFFWSFPSDSANKKQVQIDNLNKNIAGTKHRISELEKENSAAKSGREDSADRIKKLETLAKLKSDNEKMTQELKKYADNDPALLDAMKMDIDTAVEAANRWTDNIFTIKQWATSKFPGIDNTQFNKNFGISEEFDYVEAPKIQL